MINRMDEEQIRKIIEDTYDDSKEDTLRAWIRDGYSKEMRWVAINIYAGYLILSAPGIFSAIKFFRTDEPQYQIMYATIFVCCNLWIGLLSVFGWVMIQRPRINREIKRLEIRIAELNETVKNK